MLRPRDFFYPRDVVVDSGVHSRHVAAAKSSEAGDSDYIIDAVVNPAKYSEWSSAVTLDN